MLTDTERKEKRKVHWKKYYKKNKKKILARAKMQYKKMSQSEEFRIRCRKKSAIWRKLNLDKSKRSQKFARQRKKEYISKYLLKHPCKICGQSDIRYLLFHHKNPKDKDISISSSSSIEDIEKEIKKCVVLCHNCHIKLHITDRQDIDKNKTQILPSHKKIKIKKRTFITEHKKNAKCPCGEDNYLCLVFHHRDPTTKKFALSKGTTRSWAEIKEEIPKCDIMCANCHIKLHYY